MANYPAPVPPWTSPIRWMMPYVPGAPYAIAQEKAQALYALVGMTVSYAAFKECASAYIDHLAKHLTWHEPLDET